MWAFFTAEFPGLPVIFKAGFFAFLEVAVITSAVRARRSMRERGSAGIDGRAVWVITGISALLATLEASTIGMAVLRMAAPLVAALLWERGMAVERERATGRARIAWKVTPARLMVKLGLADPTDRDASDVAVHRYLTRVALAANTVRDLPGDAKDRTRRRAMKRLRKAMDQAVEYAELSSEPARLAALMDQLRLLYNTAGLARVTLASPWEAVSHRPRPALPSAPVPPDDDPDRLQLPVEHDALAADRAALAALATLATKRDKIRYAFAELGTHEDVPGAVEWLAARGVVVSRGDAYAVRTADQDKARASTLRAVPNQRA